MIGGCFKQTNIDTAKFTLTQKVNFFQIFLSTLLMLSVIEYLTKFVGHYREHCLALNYIELEM